MSIGGKTKGSLAGYKASNGRLYISIDRTDYLAHHIAWYIVTGEWPSKTIDHENRDPSDNRWSNLREANQKQQNANQRRRSDNTSGYRGVYFDSRAKSKQWYSQIDADGDTHCLGYYRTPEEARDAYAFAAIKHFGEFAVYDPSAVPNAHEDRNNREHCPYKYVYCRKEPNRKTPWFAQWKVDGKPKRVGYFATAEEAHNALPDELK